ncbi:hypothetical protein DV738_g5321, partial [Chaetothyriales sp. CBS 135597]
MARAQGSRRGRLGQGLDREVHQVVRKIIDEKTQYGGDYRPTFASIYDEIKGSNSSLNRRPKKVLEESIERVLEVVNQDSAAAAVSADSGDSDSPVATPRRQQSNGLNRSIVAMWPKSVPAPPKEGTTDPEPLKQLTGEAINGEPARKKRKRAAAATAIDHSPPTHVSLADLGGIDDIIQQFSELLYMPLIQPESMASSKIKPIRGILIHGPPGCGKTSIANAIAAEFGVNFINVSAPSIVSGMSGESEKALRDHFEEAKRVAPSILFLDEIDAVATKRESASRDMEKRIVAQLATCMDDLDVSFNDGKPVVVLAATTRPDSLDAGLRRAGRFDKEVIMSVPSEAMRQSVLQAITRDTLLADDVDLAVLAKKTPGFVGADLKDLVSTASSAAMQRIQEAHEAAAAVEQQEESGDVAMLEGGTDTDTDLKPSSPAPLPPALTKLRRLILYGRTHPSTCTSITLTQHDFITSLPKVSPSALREGFATVPTTTFESIGAHLSLIEELQRTLIGPIMNPDRFRRLGIQPSSGSLLFGPPGCGKTLLAAATAHHSSANFISIAGPSLLNKYVGESEAAVRRLFHRARASVPVVIFFDELDALVPRRDNVGNDASARVVNTLLSELDGVGNSREGIYVIAATNRPDIIDPAMLRPGRLETMLYVGLPDAEGRVDILRRITKSLPGFTFSDRIADIARQCDGFSGADLESLKRRAGYAAVKRFNAAGTDSDDADTPLTLIADDFEVARTEVRRSVSDHDMKKYDRLRREWVKT